MTSLTKTLGVIDRFDGENRFLSNLYIEPDGTHVEGEYQAAKTQDLEMANMIRRSSPQAAKRLGGSCNLRPDWENQKLGIMRSLVRWKFLDHPDLRKKLLATGNAELIEGNHWGDTFWGVCRGTGENHLGKILMKVREDLKSV